MKVYFLGIEIPYVRRQSKDVFLKVHLAQRIHFMAELIDKPI